MDQEAAMSVIKTDTYQSSSELYASSYCDTYKGLPVHALQGLHGFVADKLGQYLPASGSILDLGAGSGALSQRLSDMGHHVTAMDIVEENFRLAGEIGFVKADLNDNFSMVLNDPFDAVMAVEIMEHLENPRKFLRECRNVLRAGGYLVLSTPNVDNPLSKGMFLKSGTYHWFTDYNYEKDGHIMPITQWLLRKIIHEAGFTVKWIGTYGDPLKGAGCWRRAAAKIVRLLSSQRSDMAGELLIAVLQK